MVYVMYIVYYPVHYVCTCTVRASIDVLQIGPLRNKFSENELYTVAI